MKISFNFIMVASLALMPLPVLAGFQFTAPANQNLENQITPLPSIGGQNAQMMPAVPSVQVQSAPVQPILMEQPRAPMSARPAPLNQYPQQPQQPVMSGVSSNENTLAVGFGKDLPLLTAMRQVVPQGYTYIMDDHIAVGKTVSWNGGQPWPVVLDNMVSQLGLQTQIDGKIVRVTQPLIQQPTPIYAQPYAPQQAPMSRPVRVASAPQYANPNIVFDAPQNISPLQSYASTPIAQQGPTNILAPQLQSSAIKLSTTETGDLEELKKSVVPDVTTGQWMAQSGGSLKTVLESWSNLEGVDLFWSADYDYILAGDANISGNYEQAVEELLKGFDGANPKPSGRLHPNLPHGPAVLVIETKELSN